MWFFCSTWCLFGLEIGRCLLYSHAWASSRISGLAGSWSGISLHMASSCGKLEPPSDIMVSEKSDVLPGNWLPRNRQRLTVFLRPRLVPYHHSCCIVLIKANDKASPDSREIVSPPRKWTRTMCIQEGRIWWWTSLGALEMLPDCSGGDRGPLYVGFIACRWFISSLEHIISEKWGNLDIIYFLDII